MKININDTLTIILGFLTIIGAIYRLAQVEAAINARISKTETNVLIAIDQLKDSLSDTLHGVEKKLDIHLVEYQEKRFLSNIASRGLKVLLSTSLSGWRTGLSKFPNYCINSLGFRSPTTNFRTLWGFTLQF